LTVRFIDTRHGPCCLFAFIADDLEYGRTFVKLTNVGPEFVL